MTSGYHKNIDCISLHFTVTFTEVLLDSTGLVCLFMFLSASLLPIIGGPHGSCCFLHFDFTEKDLFF